MDEDGGSDERAALLGFKPQKENVYNKLLPYAEHLDEESAKLFDDIKTNLVKAVLAQEMRPGCALWTSRLNKYIKIYGMKFCKEDHIALIKLFYELVTIPDLEPTRVNKCASTLALLLKKSYLLTRDELQLEWRPLYELCLRAIEKSKTNIGMYRYFATFETTLFNLIRECRVYFPASATQEILDEFRPKLCPFDTGEIGSAIEYMELFLPNCVKPEEADISYKLWFEEFMNLWDVCHNATLWENNMMWIMTGLAKNQAGYINWEPYIANMFDRFRRTLDLPVNFKQRQTGKPHKIDTSAIAMWVVYSLNGNKNTVFAHFEKFMQALESYFYPANTGRWTKKLRELLRKLSYYFVQRIHYERFKGPTWNCNIPKEYHMTDEDIDRFVNIMKPCIEPAMFSRMGSQDTSLALQYLSSLRPNLIIPMCLEKLHASMDSLTEPHKLTSSMMAIIAVGRYMVQGKQNNYPEGPTHVIPLLLALLPGIDPNDIRKSYVTFNFIVYFVNMIPLVNSSEAHNYHELTEEEHIVCEATANFEDFVLQFFDRLSIWVESSALDFVRLEQMANNNNSSKNKTETMAESAIGSVVGVILNQCSPDIFKSALKKFYNFATNKIVEVQVAGKMIAVVLYRFARVNPKETLKMFVPYLCDTIERLLGENPGIDKEEHIGDELLYNLSLLSEVVVGRSELLNYMDRITNVLDRTLHMACTTANHLAARMLDLMLASLTNIQPTEVRSSHVDYSTSVKDFLPIREWGKAENLKNLKIKWYMPGDKEVNQVQNLVNRYLTPELEKLNSYAAGEATLTRQELKQTLKIVIAILSCQPLLPMWEEPPYQLVNSVLDPWAFNLKVSLSGTVTTKDGSNVRKCVVDTMHKVQRKILEIDEGDTQSIQNIINIYNIVLFNRTREQDFEFHWKNFHIAKKLLEDRLHKKKLHLRHLLIDRVMLQQEFRIESRNCSFTATHKQILDDLFELGVSRYSEVRIAAQAKLFGIISYFPYSYSVLTPKLLEILATNTEENHERFKGCLYTLLGPKGSPIVARHDWDFIRQLWPAIIRSQPSEKPSIVNLITTITDSVHKLFPTIAIKLIIPESTLKEAFYLANISKRCDLGTFEEFITNGERYLKRKSDGRREAYEGTLNALLDAVEHGNLHWRYNLMAISFMKDLVHFDIDYNTRTVKFFLQALINESLNIRKHALRMLVFITVQNKPKFKKTELDLAKFPGIGANDAKRAPGERNDNRWLLYDSGKLPTSESAWEERKFVHNKYTGYYTWPKKVEVYEPASKQETAARRMDKLTEIEKEMYDFFTNEKNVEQLIKYLTLEEKKGHDQFNSNRFLMFKNLFKIFEDKLLPVFVPHIRRLVQDKHESNQRCAAELISAVIRGSKHWPFEKVNALWSTLIPILDAAIVNMCSETQMDWAVCVSMATEERDPASYHWLLEFLLDVPLRDPMSFVACNRLHVLAMVAQQQSWRNAEIFSRLFDYFKPYLSHPFQNVREKISYCLMIIFSKDITFSEGASASSGPKIKTLFEEVAPKLDMLYRHSLSKVDNNNKMEVDEACNSLELMCIKSEEEKEEAMRTFKVVAKFVMSSMMRVVFATRAEFFGLLPLAAVYQNFEADEEMSTLATNLLVVLAQTITVERHMPAAMAAVKRVAGCPLWSARAVIAEFLSVFVFYNMATINSRKEWVLEIQAVVLGLLEDERPEVRTAAAKVLGGLLHCRFLPEPRRLLDLFGAKAATRASRRKAGATPKADGPDGGLRTRHSGVLGLCSFVDAHPYDVPDYLPEVFGRLGPHLGDAQPIPATIRKTMGDFKRTHHDNWEAHKLKFTEDELLILTDLTVPPSYYV